MPIKSGEVLLIVQKTKFDAGEYKIQLCVTCEIKFLAEINTSMLCKTISFLNDDDAWLRHEFSPLFKPFFLETRKASWQNLLIPWSVSI